MKKSDLKNFDVVQLRNGEVFLVAKDKNVMINRSSIGDLIFFKEDLTHDMETERDVVAVRRENMPQYLMFDCLDNMPIIWERKEKIELTQLERLVLEHVLKKGYMFIARDRDNDLRFFGLEPLKFHDKFWNSDDGRIPTLFNDLFQFVKWEQEEPMSIKELLENE